MSIQDDYFDLASFLEGKKEADLLESIWDKFCKNEEELINSRKLLVDIKKGLKALKFLENL